MRREQRADECRPNEGRREEERGQRRADVAALQDPLIREIYTFALLPVAEGHLALRSLKINLTLSGWYLDGG